MAGLAATPVRTATGMPVGAQTTTADTASEQAKDALKDAKGTKLVLLGTAAGPVPGRSRQMTSHVMLSNGAAYVLDCGMGVTDQLRAHRHSLQRAQVDLHHASPRRPQHRIRPAADRRLDPRRCRSTCAPSARRRSSR